MNSGKEAKEAPARAAGSGWFEMLVELIKATAWPASILVIFLFIKAPLLSALSELPSLIQSAQNVTVGSISINLRQAGIPNEVRKGMSKLSRSAIVVLLETGQTGWGYLDGNWESTSSRAGAVKELQANKLVSVTPTKAGESYPLQYTLSAEAKNAYDVLLGSIISQLAEDRAVISK
jgi:hypothetical protein